MPRDYLQSTLGLQAISVQGWKENEPAIFYGFGIETRAGLTKKLM